MTSSLREWLNQLSDEDVNFLKRFILASGSLKAVAAEYGVSYPTIRLRVDRLIQKIQLVDDARVTSEFERRARALYADGKLELDAMRELIKLHDADSQQMFKPDPEGDAT
ncbi:MAG: DUF2089 family protein [Planctomycetaceae bacterium]